MANKTWESGTIEGASCAVPVIACSGEGGARAFENRRGEKVASEGRQR